MQQCTCRAECQLFLTTGLFHGALIIFHLTYKLKNIAGLIQCWSASNSLLKEAFNFKNVL